MFTGIIEEVGVVQEVGPSYLIVKASKVLSDLNLGDSISVNGVCLTVTDFHSGKFACDLSAETKDRSNLSELNAGNLVNLERPLLVGGRIGGHFVQGHVDGVGIIEEFAGVEDGRTLRISIPEPLRLYIVEKGSITIEGISFTVARVLGPDVTVAVIPYTMEHTNLSGAVVGQRVNLEVDVLAKYVSRLLPEK